MTRLLVAFSLLTLLTCSVGCQICCAPFDNCISAYIDRPGDYRGCGPMYRAGSIFSGGEYGICQSDCGDVMYIGETDGIFTNAGNYGTTTPISMVPSSIQQEYPADSPESLPAPPRISPIAKPKDGPEEVIIPGPYKNPNNGIPSTQELIDLPRRTTTTTTTPESFPVPVTPPGKPRVETPSFEEMPTETIPFSPNDAVTPPQQQPTMESEGELPITLEELRKLDPSVSDVQIISIEDAAVENMLR